VSQPDPVAPAPETFTNAQEINEGKARVLVENVSNSTGPMKKASVFYNPAMSLNRDVSVALTPNFLKNGCSVLDGLAATGIRGIRLALETGMDIELTLNDANPVAHAYMQKNLEINGVNGIAENENVNTIASQSRYWHVDIDPYGTPVPFLDAAIQAVQNGGVLAVTATDTAVLCGTYPKTSARRYMASITKCHCYPEVAVRLLMGHIARLAAIHDRGMVPLLSFTTNHYVRLFLRLKEGAGRADAALENVGNFSFNNATHEFEVGSGDMGPIWLGDIHDASVLKGMKISDHLAAPRKLAKMLELWRAEAGMPVFYYDIDEICRLLKCSPPRMEDIAAAFDDAGLRISRTHFLPTGFKTDADVANVKKIIKGIAFGRKSR
jgi:tRNA (guanine26-N2/guanine27-N2)-dimethyltransferase